MSTPTLQPPFYYHRLDNGLEMVGQRMPSLGSAVFGFQFDAGAKNEDDQQLGLGQLLEDMLFQGTANRDARHISDAIELLGARRFTGTGYETARYGAQVVHTRLDEALALWADILLHPTFPKKEFEQLRPPLLQAIRRRDDEPNRIVGEMMTKSFYRNSRIGRPQLGTIETVSGLNVGDIKAFYERFYRSNRCLFAIAGNFDWDRVVASVTELFGSMPGDGPTPYTDEPQPGDTIAVQERDGEQEHLYFGWPSVTWGDPDYYANLLGVEIFGGGMTSRLFSEVREKRGLVYHVSASTQATRSLGAIFVYGSTPPEKAHETASVILAEMKKLTAEGVSQDELDRAKVQIKSELVMHSESANARMNSIMRSWWYERRVIPTQQVKDEIDKVTTEQIQRVLQRFPSTRPLTIVALGPVARDTLLADLTW